MFDGSLPEIADLAGLDAPALVDAAQGWSRAENAACARKQAVLAEIFTRRTGLPADEREQWWVDPEAAVAAELATALNVSRFLALAQTHRGVALRDRLPKVAALFEAGLISDLLVRAIVYRTALITDDDAMAAVDAELADQVRRWGALSITKTEDAIDALVERHDPAALRRSRASVSSRTVEFGSPEDPAGITSMWARLYAPDAALIEQRVEEMACSVCEADPRTLAERRADALTALAAGAELVCACGTTDCPGAGRAAPPKNAVVHVVAHPDTITAATNESAPAPTDSPRPPTDPADTGDEPADPSGESADTVEPADTVAPAAEPADPAAESVEPIGESVEPATPDGPGRPAAAGHCEAAAAFWPAPVLPIDPRTECEPAIARPVVAPADPAAGPLTVPLAQCHSGIALPVIDASNLKVGGPPATPVPPSCPAPPAFVIGGGILPAPLLAATLDRATVREVRHPGIDAPPEPRYTPSRQLADFVRCRDLTCRWPGCDKPSYQCDLDHTVPYPVGPTHASNVKCLCRFHHLLKTFYCGEGGWCERQLPDGTLIFTSPTGHTYTTHPGSKLLFPTLCAPTGELWTPGHEPTLEPSSDRGAMMPKRRHPRAHNRRRAIEAERRLNDEYVAERNKPPPF
jgi:hypothetical protein